MNFKLIAFAAAACALFISGCSKDNDGSDGPAPLPRTSRITQITTSIPSQSLSGNTKYTYDAQGRLTSVSEFSTSGSSVIEYSYGAKGSVTIATETTSAREGTLTYSDRVTLTEGRVNRIDGVYKWLREDGSVYSSREYTYRYTYDAQGHLTAIGRSEWDPSTPQSPWQWVNTLEWNGDLLVKYTDYDGHTMPTFIYTYEYSQATAEQPMVLPFTFHKQYDELVRAGYFGKLPARLIARRTQTGLIGEQYVRVYTYSVTDGRISDFSTTINYGTDKAYTVYNEVTYAK